MQKILEQDVQASCLQYLAVRKHFFFRMNNIPVFSQGKFRALPEFTPKGLPDAVLIKNGKFIALEFKGSSGKLSEHQEEMAVQIKRAGGEYYVIRSIEDLQKIGL